MNYDLRHWEIGTPWIVSLVWDHPEKRKWRLELWLSGKKRSTLSRGHD